MADLHNDFVHLARLALGGQLEDVATLARKTMRAIIRDRPDLAALATQVLQSASSSPTREASPTALPVDLDSRLELLRREVQPILAIEPTWPPQVAEQLIAVIEERERESELAHAGLTPTRSLLFVGPPGVGKTMAARWLASSLNRPLLTLDLAAVMSSFLGRTGNNIRVVLDYARETPTVLLLDEFDAIAKRRDDAGEIGELKRLVTVLLQSVDEWPASGVLVAATNHPELLDPAIWRRFDRVVVFPYPSADDLKKSIESLVEGFSSGTNLDSLSDQLAALLQGSSFADVAREINAAKRRAIIGRISLEESLIALASRLVENAGLERRLSVAAELERRGLSQRKIQALIGVSRDTLRKHSKGTK